MRRQPSVVAPCLPGLHSDAPSIRTAPPPPPPLFSDVKVHLNLGIAYSSLDDMPAAEAAFRRAAAVGPTDGRPPLALARLLAKLNRPAVTAEQHSNERPRVQPVHLLSLQRAQVPAPDAQEAIDEFYQAAQVDGETFDQVKSGVGTARAQQGRLAEALVNFQSAARMDPKNEKLAAALVQMPPMAERLATLQAGLSNAVPDLCGTPCQDVVDAASVSICSVTFADGCGDTPPPAGFRVDSLVSELCAHACAFTKLTASTKDEL